MAKRKIKILVAVDTKYRAVLETLKQRDGVSFTWQIEQAIALWAAEKGIAMKDLR